jgi:hypothetical protein
LAIDLFRSLFGTANISPRRSHRMQGLPPEDPKDYVPLLPNSLEGSPEGVVNNEVVSEIGSSTPLEDSILPVNPLLNLREDSILLRLNSLGEIITEDHTRIPTGPHVESGVDDPPFQSQSFRTPVHTTGVFRRTSSGHDIFYKLTFLAS